MQAKHEPREAFVEQLESRVASEARRRNSLQPPVRWLMGSPARLAAAICAIVVVSMAAGGVAVDAAYRSQKNERRDLILGAYQARLQVAQLQLQVAEEELKRVQRNVSVGLATNVDLLEIELKMREAEASVRKIRLDIEEVRLSGDEPLTTVTAPLVGGRDFVMERWLVELEVPQRALELEKLRHQAAQRRFSVGVADKTEVDQAAVRLLELEVALISARQRIEIRKRFINKQTDAPEAELRLLETQALAQLQTLGSQVEAAKLAVIRAEALFKKGLVDNVQVAQVRLKVLTLEAEIAKVRLDVELIQKRRREKQ